MSAVIELDEQRREALKRVARQRKVSLRHLLGRAVDDFLERLENEELLESSAQVARRSGLTEDDDIEGIIKNIRETRLAER